MCLYGVYIILPKNSVFHATGLYSNGLWRVLTPDMVITQLAVLAVRFRGEICKCRILNVHLYDIVHSLWKLYTGFYEILINGFVKGSLRDTFKCRIHSVHT